MKNNKRNESSLRKKYKRTDFPAGSARGKYAMCSTAVRLRLDAVYANQSSSLGAALSEAQAQTMSNETW